MRIRELLGVGALGSLLSVAEAGDVKYKTINDVPEVTDSTINDSIKEGFYMLWIYGSKPSTKDAYEAMERGNNLLLGLVNENDVNTYRFDTQRIADRLGSGSPVTNYLKSEFGVEGRPSVLMFCNGEIVYKLDGAAPKPEVLDKAKSFLTTKLMEYSQSCQ